MFWESLQLHCRSRAQMLNAVSGIGTDGCDAAACLQVPTGLRTTFVPAFAIASISWVHPHAWARLVRGVQKTDPFEIVDHEPPSDWWVWRAINVIARDS